MKTRTFKLNKLVRDRIVEHHISMKGQVKYKTLTGNKLTQALLNKVVEEVKELKVSDLKAAEIVDLKELVDALAYHLVTVTPAELKKLQADKRLKNGAFKKGHFIDTVTLPTDNKWAKYYAADPKKFPEIKS